ncbi:LysR family transcriptional regulator [Affinibrenneria salicis]|uniref:LysR family transcriptional regulator n=1 Tax=Affinibrenneria salicis TaxID=2590031 RepID=A0A5J5G3V1_9GAMM|nr:LysR family transcriptional regulator [Affinibrenneria salicis]KAA9001341.1 LysR family transcriptional regulator [Affinibrenneria salicis]
MELNQLRCFIAVADELHFGHAAQNLDMLPSALGRYIKLLEEELGTRLLTRSTRNVSLTPHGALFLDDARKIVADADALLQKFQRLGRQHSGYLRLGAIDSAAVGLIPHILHAFRDVCPNVEIQIVEDKSSRLLPKLLSGRLDLIFIRPMAKMDDVLESEFLFYENVVLVISSKHKLAAHQEIRVEDLIDVPLIVPERKVRPHSYDLTMGLFEHVDFKPRIVQIADEKQTIINMVAAELGAAVMPRWVSRISTLNVSFVPLAKEYIHLRKTLPISAVWMKDVRDKNRESMMNIVRAELTTIACQY